MFTVSKNVSNLRFVPNSLLSLTNNVFLYFSNKMELFHRCIFPLWDIKNLIVTSVVVSEVVLDDKFMKSVFPNMDDAMELFYQAITDLGLIV